MSQDKTALSIPAQTEQEITLGIINNAFAQCCFDYGALVTLPNRGSIDRFKWAAEHAAELSAAFMSMYQSKGGKS